MDTTNTDFILVEPHQIKQTTKKHTQNWNAYNKAKQNELITILEILEELTNLTIKEKKHKTKGRPPTTLKEQIFYTIIQSYNQKSSRRTISYLKIAKQLKYTKKTPHFNTILTSLKNPKLTTALKHLIKISGLPLKNLEEHFAIDASGWSTKRYGRWLDVRTKNQSKRRQFIKAHISVGAKTNIITSATITPGNSHDTKEFPQLIQETNQHFKINEVSADKAYCSDKNLRIVEQTGGIPYIAFKNNNKLGPRRGKNTRGMKTKSQIWREMLVLYTRYPTLFKQRYHQRSNSETAFHMIKLTLGGTLRSKNYQSQQNELLAKILCHNLCVLAQEAHESDIHLSAKNVQEELNAQKIAI